MELQSVDRFEKLVGQFQSMYDEVAVLSKKSPNDAMNQFKLNLINNLLEQGNRFLGERYKPFGTFSLFDEDNVPQNSDVVFIMSQYLQSFEKLRADQVYYSQGTWYWLVEGKKLQTVKPKRLRE